jgi:hypothetical protein
MTTYDDEYVEDAPQVYDGPPIPVHITSGSHTDYTERLAPDFGSAGTFQLQPAGSAQPVQVLQRRYRRNKARVLVMSLNGSTSVSTPSLSQTAVGATTAPTAGQGIATIASANLPAGTYEVSGSVYLDGTVTPADGDNFKLNINSTHLLAPATSVVATPFGPFFMTLNGAQALVVQANAAGSAAAVYHASITAIPQTLNQGVNNQSSAAVFHNRPDVLSLPNVPPNTGIIVVTAPYSFDWESQQPLYGVGIGGLVTVSVIDETYADATT